MATHVASKSITAKNSTGCCIVCRLFPLQWRIKRVLRVSISPLEIIEDYIHCTIISITNFVDKFLVANSLISLLCENRQICCSLIFSILFDMVMAVDINNILVISTLTGKGKYKERESNLRRQNIYFFNPHWEI